MEHYMDPIPAPVRNPSYMTTYAFEDSFEVNSWRTWFSRNWTLAIHLTILYVTFIQFGTAWMKSRRPYRLQLLLTLWNIGLAVFSAAGFLRSIPEVTHILGTKPHGWYHIICSRQEGNAASAFWALVGTFSKAAELGDTVFIVLRKQPLIFLHWYHHATVMLYTWYTYEDQDPCHRLFIVMNYFIHSIMYSYYACRALGIKIPRQVSMLITSLQLFQMVVGCGLNLVTYYWIRTGQAKDCARSEWNVGLASAMYVSYLVLFAHFFYQSYIVKKARGPRGAAGEDGAAAAVNGSQQKAKAH